MEQLRQRVVANSTTFFEEVNASIDAAYQSVSGHERFLQRGYEQLVSLQSWRAYIYEQRDGPALEFFTEAQNDALVSLTLAAHALWRPALKSIRSMIEGVLFAEYYKDHPVEFMLWERGEHRLTFSGAKEYFAKHPLLGKQLKKLAVLEALSHEYRELSKAVHGSARPFRMTQQGFPAILLASPEPLGKWYRRHASAIQVVNLFLLCSYKNEVSGARNRNLRKAISLSITSEKKRQNVSEVLSAKLFPLPE